MSTLRVTPSKRRRRGSGFPELAGYLGVGVSTLRGWVSKRPELRPVLRARRQGKQWRVDFPEWAEVKPWIDRIRQAVAHFKRERDPETEAMKRTFCRGLGAGDDQRDRDIEILRHAMLLKRSKAKPLVELDNGEMSAENLPDTSLDEWKAKQADVCATARIISANFNCRVEAALTHWEKFLLHQRDRNHQHNAFDLEWLKEHGLSERVKPILADDPQAIIPFQTRGDIQFLTEKTDTQIDAVVAEVKELWPEPHHWQEARHFEKQWQSMTLAEAAKELIDNDKAVTRKAIVPLLHRNPVTQVYWKIRQGELELERQGRSVPREDADTYGRRGISLSEFHQRYTRTEFLDAKRIAEASVSPQLEIVKNLKQAIDSESAEASEAETRADNNGFGELDATGKSVTSATEKKQCFVSPERRARVRREFEQSTEWKNLTQEERQPIEKVLRRSIKAYAKDPFKEDFDIA